MGNWLRPQEQNYLAKVLMDAKGYLLFDPRKERARSSLQGHSFCWFCGIQRGKRCGNITQYSMYFIQNKMKLKHTYIYISKNVCVDMHVYIYAYTYLHNHYKLNI